MEVVIFKVKKLKYNIKKSSLLLNESYKKRKYFRANPCKLKSFF